MTEVFGGIRAPSTLGSFLRSFSWGNVCQAAVISSIICRGRSSAGADKVGSHLVIAPLPARRTASRARRGRLLRAAPAVARRAGRLGRGYGAEGAVATRNSHRAAANSADSSVARHTSSNGSPALTLRRLGRPAETA